MAVVGGGIGVLIAWMLAVIVRSATPVPMAVPISAVVWRLVSRRWWVCFSAFIPRRKARELDPIEALRFEN